MNLDIANVATWLVLIYAILGAVMVILSAVIHGIDPDLRLTFNSYLDSMVVAAGGLAIGRGLKAHGKGK